MARDVKIVRLGRVAMFADPLEKNGKAPKLEFSLRGQYPRINVYTGQDVDNDDSFSNNIAAPMDAKALYILLDAIEKAAVNDTDAKLSMECWSHKYVDGKPTEEKIIVGTVVCGRDDDGVMYLTVTEENKPTILFKYIISDYTRLRTPEGQLSKRSASNLVAKWSVKLLRNLYDKLLTNNVLNDAENHSTTVTYTNAPDTIIKTI